MKKLYSAAAFTILCLLLACAVFAGPKDPIEGADFDNYLKQQNVELQSALSIVFGVEKGFIVAGPLDPNVANPNIARLYNTVRVICPNLENLAGSTDLLTVAPGFVIKGVQSFIEYALADSLPGFRGMIAYLTYNQKDYAVQFQTINQLRFLLWAKNTISGSVNADESAKLRQYAAAASDYLYEIDRNNLEAPEPKAAVFNLPDSIDLYAKAPEYVIQGYQNYKDYLFAHAPVATDFATDILGFIPTKETYDKLKIQAPAKAFPNKEAPLLQEEFRKFFQRGGQMQSMQTLTKAIFDSLQPGEYFFGVGLNGNIRFGRELTREEVAKIEQTGQKPARANHAFLFPGEPILTAGAFFIGCDGVGRLIRVNTQSGHYFYSNITSTIKEDIAERSDGYFLSIGHFFSTLDSLEIVYSDVVVTKL
jgi:hypothetical protein